MKNNIVIISHPRSGSYWFQECIDYYDTNELFNINNVDVKFFNGKITFSNYINGRRSGDIVEYLRREEIFNSIKHPKSVKIHHYQFLDQWIQNFVLNLKDTDIIFFERKDKVKAFYSLLISNALSKFKGLHTKQEIKIDLSTIDECWQTIFNVDPVIEKIKEKFNCSHYFYEDALNLEDNKWFNKSRARIVKQDTTESVAISNIDEVTKFILEKNYDISSRQIF